MLDAGEVYSVWYFNVGIPGNYTVYSVWYFNVGTPGNYFLP